MTEEADGLPIDRVRGDLEAALEAGNVVVAAATGSGKSTRLPVWAARAGRVLVVEPRRVAATSLATFVARTLGGQPGDRVGYAVRLDARYATDSEIVFVTPGVALRWHADDGLAGFDTVILDELHERRWDTDLLLALLRDADRHRLVLASATFDGERLARHIDGRYIRAEGRSHAVTVHHVARDATALPTARDLGKRTADAVRRALAETSGDVLVFLPGRGEIRETQRSLGEPDAEVATLHASASAAEQGRALRPGDRRRVILATNVAETSLTVPGVTAVVDSGLERRTQRRNGRTVLALQPVARASADQRKGRAGRTAPGICLRLWGEHAPLEASIPPETQREDLTELVLAAACSGRPARSLTFPESLPERTLGAAERMLTDMAAIDGEGHATDRGRKLFSLPVDSVLAHLVTAMPDGDTAVFMADLAAALTTRESVARITGDASDRDELVNELGRRCDATLLVAALRDGALPGVSVARGAREEARRLAGQIRELADVASNGDGARALADVAVEALRAAVTALPTRAFVRRARRRQALGNGEREVLIDGDSLMGSEDEAALVLAEHSVPGRGTRQTVTVATCLAPVTLDDLVAADVAEPAMAEPVWEDGRLRARRQWWHAGRVVAEDETEPEGDAAREALARLILDGKLLSPAGERLRDDLEAWELYVRLGYAEGEVPEAGPWLRGRLAALGVERGEEAELLEPEDLRFEGVPAWERERFDRYYPRRVSLSDLELRIHYDVRRKRVVAEHVAGRRKHGPQRWELPAWPGWRVAFQRASRVVELS